jgi:prephenate dehydratase
MKIGYLGPEGSYSHLAAKLFLQPFEKQESKKKIIHECVPFRNFSEVFTALDDEKVDAVALPIENSLQGGVLQNLDLLQASTEVYAVKELVIRVDHRLVYKKGTSLSQIGRVYSHRQALDQCAAFLSKFMPFVSLRETESTALSVTRAMEDESGKSAAIAGAHITNLRADFQMSEECISDEKNNFTHFLLLEKGKSALPKTSDRIFFSAVGPHRPGGLVELLQIIAKHNINMSKIESRPVKNSVGDYRFFIEAECDIGAKEVQDMLLEIKEFALESKLLGAYMHG